MLHHVIRSTGAKVPLMSMGTWKVSAADTYETIREAIRVGYRAFDCAAAYGNEAQVGKALASAYQEEWVKREDLFLTSKLWNSEHAREDVKPALRKTLEDLQTDYLDLYLMHWPVALTKKHGFPPSKEEMISLEDLPIADTWAAMEECCEEGLTKHIGVSNFSQKKLQCLLQEAQKIKPHANQIELHAYLQQKELVQFCLDNDVMVMGYSSLGSFDRPDFLKQKDEPVLLENPTVMELATAKSVSPAQLLLGWCMRRGIAVMPKSTHPSRILENFQSQKVEFTKDEMEKMASLDIHRRYIDGTIFTPEGGPYTLSNLWDEE